MVRMIHSRPHSTVSVPSTFAEAPARPHPRDFLGADVRARPSELPGLQNLFSRKLRTRDESILPRWEMRPRQPYHDYVHQLVEAGWDNLKPLDNYMGQNSEDKDLVVSVLDISKDNRLHRWPDIFDEAQLRHFLTSVDRENAQVRLFMAEQSGNLASGVMDAFGTALKLDPRFFQWNVQGHRHLLTPSVRHRAPFTSIGFTVLNTSTPSTVDTEFFRISYYVKPDDEGDGWTGLLSDTIIFMAVLTTVGLVGIFLFNSHSKMDMSVNQLVEPPLYEASPPTRVATPSPREAESFRELYLSTFDLIDLEEASRSPFYTVHYLLRLNIHCWSQVIHAIQDEDQRLNAISEASIDHVEEINKMMLLVRRGGSLSWPPSCSPRARQAKEALEEDIQHVMDQAEYLWESRRKMAAVHQRAVDSRIKALTNAFTYVYDLFMDPPVKANNLIQLRSSLAHQQYIRNERVTNHRLKRKSQHLAVLRRIDGPHCLCPRHPGSLELGAHLPGSRSNSKLQRVV